MKLTEAYLKQLILKELSLNEGYSPKLKKAIDKLIAAYPQLRNAISPETGDMGNSKQAGIVLPKPRKQWVSDIQKELSGTGVYLQATQAGGQYFILYEM